MPRGGRREGAGRKTAWESGCTFPETTVIRVPKYLKDEILEIAHRLDAGEEIDLDTKLLRERNNYLEGKVLELERELNKPKQLDLLSTDSVTKSKKQMNKIRDELLKDLPVGKSSPVYKDEKRKYDRFIELVTQTE